MALTELPLLEADTQSQARVPRPDWLKIRLGQTKAFHGVKQIVHGQRLATVCEEAACPNRAECWSRGTATIMIMGDTCTRSCGFCNVKTGRPLPLDALEPIRTAEAIQAMGLRYTVITSVDRDELPDGGAAHFAETIRRVHELNPHCKVEVLTPDFKGDLAHLELVLDAQPEVFAHNMETVARLHLQVRPQAKYWRSLQVVGHAAKRGLVSKSGIMVGLGETPAEVRQVLRDLADVGCSLVTIGQYLQPSPRHLPVMAYVHPDRFVEYAEWGKSFGIRHVEAGPLVRSSYKAETQERLMQGGARST
ncbi:lipoyl synthase [candidate division KSB1 bacterium]|nr:lipoyl synthase [candidate division KSB1 bacterium]